MSDRQFLTEILLACSRGATRLFRNNVGQGWVGKSTRYERTSTITVQPGDVVIRQARPLHAGLHVGSGDLVGWRSVTITPEMVGTRLAVFCSLEAKQVRDRLSEDQQTWMAAVNFAGGIAVEVRSVDEAKLAVQD